MVVNMTNLQFTSANQIKLKQKFIVEYQTKLTANTVTWQDLEDIYTLLGRDWPDFKSALQADLVTKDNDLTTAFNAL